MSKEIQVIESILNLQDAMGNLDGDVELMQEILGVFLEMAPEQLDELGALIQAGRIPEVAVLANSLKGSASNFCASRFVDTAGKLERLAKAGSLDGAGELLQQLRADFAELRDIQAAIDWEEVVWRWSP